MAWPAWQGLPEEPVREMLIESVEKRFGAVKALPEGCQLVFITGNGGAYLARETRAIACALGFKILTTPVCSPQCN